ncbi:MAG: AI-2E family transporter [Oscillospiraceae bacterium]|nr:AI-2E family transporter [Oscillospiraceae bacterium]
MKFQPDNEKTTIAVYIFFIIAASTVFFMTLQRIDIVIGTAARLTQALTPAIYGLAIAFLLNPAVKFFEAQVFLKLFKKIGRTVNRGISLLCTYIVFFVAIGMFFAIVMPQFISSLIGIGARLPSYYKSLQIMFFGAMDAMSGMFADDPEISAIWLSAYSNIMNAIDDVLPFMIDWLTNDLLNVVAMFVGRITSGVFTGILGLILSIYFLIEKEKLMAQARKICEAVFPERATGILYECVVDINRRFGGFVTGKIIESIIMGILCYIGMVILRLPFALLISVIVGVFNVVPYFGSIVGAIPGIVLLLIYDIEKGPVQSFIFFIFILILQQFDGNVLGPKILGDSTGLTAFWVIFSIMLFSNLFSVVGMLIGVPLFAVIYHLTRRFINHILTKKDKSTDTGDYATEKNPLLRGPVREPVKKKVKKGR